MPRERKSQTMSIHAIDAYLGAEYPDAGDLIRVPRGTADHIVDHTYALSHAEAIAAPILSPRWSAEYKRRLDEHRASRDDQTWRVSAYNDLIGIWHRIAIARKGFAPRASCREALETWAYWVLLRDEILYPRYESIPAPRTDDSAYVGPPRDY